MIKWLCHDIFHMVPGLEGWYGSRVDTTGINPWPISALQLRCRAWYGSLGLIPGPIWKMSCNNLLIYIYRRYRSKFDIEWSLSVRRKFCHFTEITICYYMWWCCCNFFLDIYIYVIKFNSTVLELDLWSDKFGFSLEGIWTHAIDTLEHQTLSLMSSALDHFATSAVDMLVHSGWCWAKADFVIN